MEALESRQGRGVLAVPEFRRLWLTGLAVSVARWLEMLVVGVVVFQQTGSPFLVAAMTLLRVAPMALLGLLSGIVADLVPRRSALLSILLMQGAALAAMSALALADALQVWQVALACVVGGIGWAADNPVRRMMIGESVGPARIGAAMSLDVLSSNISRVGGPVLGGVLLGGLGAGAAFGLAAALYLVAVAVAFRLRAGRRAARRRGATILGELREGLTATLAIPELRGVMVITMVFNLFAWPCTSMIPVIGKDALGLGPGGIGVLASMEGVGALATAALVGALLRPSLHGATYLGGTAFYLLMMIGFAVAPGPVPAAAALMASGIGGACFATMQGTLTWLVTPPELRGRALGLLSTAIGSGVIGFLQVGLLANWLGAPAATCLVAGCGLVMLGLSRPLWLPLLRAG
ncbi:MFS transporter [Falsiroseomonas sp. HW251]|uniref:MFS transporter n=1 Tax=Falsiroseomonas sp. HW251 TaxID=3390998 RepID=UPI003D31C833